MSPVTAALILAWVAIILLGLALSGMLRRLYLLEQRGLGARSSVSRITGPGIGAPAPKISLERGASIEFTDVTLLFFASAMCSSCGALLDALPDVMSRERRLTGAAVLFGERGDWERVERLQESGIRVLENRNADFGRYRVTVTPYVVLVDGVGTVIAADVLGSVDQLRGFLVVHLGQEESV